jgi:DNA polymerase III alpha subunit
MPDKEFVHLHTHSHYSLLDGLAKVDQLIDRAKELGMKSIALTDHGVMYGSIEFYQKAKKAGLHPILGVEAYLAPRKLTDKVPKIDSAYFHQILLAETHEGYQNLMALTSIAHLEGMYYKPRIDLETLKKHSKGLIATSSCLGGMIPQALLEGDTAKAEKVTQQFIDIFGKNSFFIELQHHPKMADQMKTNPQLIEIARKFDLKLIATGDIHYAFHEEKEAHEVLLAVNTGASLDQQDRMTLADIDLHMESPEFFAENFAHVPEIMANSVEIAERCQVELDLGKNYLPDYTVPEGKTENSYLRELCLANIPYRYDHKTAEIREKALAQLDFELQTIERMGFASYFLIVQDFVNWAKDQGIYVGPGRGSAAGSIVAYLLKITDLDPLQYGLLFERFLNPDRISMPDIDMDFADDRRGEVINYVRQKYGDDHVAGIITFGTMMSRAAVRDVGRALAMTYGEVDAIAKLIPPPVQGRHIPLRKSLDMVPELKQRYDTDPAIKRLIDLSCQLEGTVRHASQHACAIVITPKPLVEYCPVQTAQKGDVGQVTQYSMKPIEEIGLLKMDFLGLSNLTVMRNAIRIIKKVYGQEIDIHNLPLDDKPTYDLFTRGDTTGVFQLECLSGDTIVSNTTLKKLYETQDKRKIEAVYLDEGKVHKNQILGIYASGKKDLYTLIGDNNWYIKSTKDHYFMTEDGWKQLGELKPGDRVLTKTNAKHLVYKTCDQCGKKINGYVENKSLFCYSCSAGYYKNPSQPVSRYKITEKRKEFYENGGVTWNRGLTKATNQILKATSEKISESLIGRTWEEMYGEARAQQLHVYKSEIMSGSKNPMFGVKSPHRKGGYREDLGHYVRSNWEADFARILKLHNISYFYEPQTFALVRQNGDQLSYTPDFYIPAQNTFYEIKGWMHDLDKEKMELFQEQYPEYVLRIISATKFAEFALKYKNLVAWECPKLPEKNYDYITIKEIKYSGVEETYDIKMQSPGNNFVASGFVVHNSDGMKRYIKELKPTNFNDIVAMVSLYRPGPMQFIPSYIARKHGKEAVKYAHPKLESSFKETFGIPVYQEQVMQASKDVAGFTGGEADTLRKAMGKKIAKLMAEMRVKFIEGAEKNSGIDRKTSASLFQEFEDFAAYGFNKSHAACYAMIAFQTAYLKAHYPAAFMAALLTSDFQNLDRIAIEIAECERMGIKVRPPDVNESFVEFGVVREEGQNEYIRFALSAIKNVGLGVAEKIYEERRLNGPYKSLEDFICRLGTDGLNKKVVEALAKTGALDSLGERNQLLAGVEIIIKYASTLSKQLNNNQMDLFGMSNDRQTIADSVKIPLPDVGPAEKKQQLAWEKELLGIYVTDHPLNEVAHLCLTFGKPINEITTEMDQKKLRVAGILTTVKKIITKSNEPMLFVGIEDTTGLSEILVFPKLYADTHTMWQADQVVVVEGRVSTKDGQIKIIANQVWELTPDLALDSFKATEELTFMKDELKEKRAAKRLSPDSPAAASYANKVFGMQGPTPRKQPAPSFEKSLYITLPPGTSKDILEGLKKIITTQPGDTKVLLRVPSSAGYKEIEAKTRVSVTETLLKELDTAVGMGNSLVL